MDGRPKISCINYLLKLTEIYNELVMIGNRHLMGAENGKKNILMVGDCNLQLGSRVMNDPSSFDLK